MNNKFVNAIELEFDDVLIVPECNTEINSRSEVNTKNLYNCHPIINANMNTTGNTRLVFQMLKQGFLACLHKFYPIDELKYFFMICKNYEINTKPLFLSFGLREGIDKIKEYVEELKDFEWNILLDVPNGYMKSFIELVKETKELVGNQRDIIAGNVVDGIGARYLFEAGADFVKVGIGPGSTCKTREITGVSRPQLSAILDCVKVAKEYNKFIIADGGCKTTGDICKALVAGADIVMLGGMYAGTDEASGHQIESSDGIKYKENYGMSSFKAQSMNYNKITEFGTSEGVESIFVEYVGSIESVNKKILGAIRSCCSYIGVNSVVDMKTAKFRIL